MKQRGHVGTLLTKADALDEERKAINRIWSPHTQPIGSSSFIRAYRNPAPPVAKVINAPPNAQRISD